MHCSAQTPRHPAAPNHTHPPAHASTRTPIQARTLSRMYSHLLFCTLTHTQAKFCNSNTVRQHKVTRYGCFAVRQFLRSNIARHTAALACTRKGAIIPLALHGNGISMAWARHRHVSQVVLVASWFLSWRRLGRAASGGILGVLLRLF